MTTVKFNKICGLYLKFTAHKNVFKLNKNNYLIRCYKLILEEDQLILNDSFIGSFREVSSIKMAKFMFCDNLASLIDCINLVKIN